MTDKQVAVETLARLPETASLAEMVEELRIAAALRDAEADVTAGRVRPHEEVKRLLAIWSEEWKTNRSLR